MLNLKKLILFTLFIISIYYIITGNKAIFILIKKKEMYVARDFSVEKKTTETQMLKDNMK